MLVFGSSFVASADDALRLDSSSLSVQDDASSMTWPMLPGESVNDLARMFYPNNKAMQQQFVAKTLRLNSETESNLKATKRFESPTLLVIPTLKSLSNKSLAKNAVKSSKKSNKQSLKMSYGLKQVVEQLPQKLMQDYEELVSKNVFLKEQLIKLNEKIVFLQAKLDDLKLIFDKTLVLPSNDLQAQASASVANLPVAIPPDASQPNTSQPATKKVFKNLNKQAPAPTSEPTIAPAVTPSFFDSLNMDLVKALLAAVALLLLGAFALKKYRERMFENLSFAATKMQHTVSDFSGYFEDKSSVKKEQNLEVVQQVKAAKEIETRLSATLEEAKLLLSVNRATDAIAHLKATISAQPKASLNHWLYLLEVFRKLNMKDEFEQYAESLHQTLNVMTPVWYEKSAAIYVPLSLEEFPHIMEQLYGVWPGELASVYLRSLISDNRGGDRVGFGKEVVGEILFLIELIHSYKDIPN